MQLQFLPYHSSLVTWIQRIVIAIDLALLWYFWPKIMEVSPRSEVFPRSCVQGRVVHWLAITGTALIIIFTWGVATFPGEPHDKKLFIATAAWFPWPCKPDAATNNLDAATNNLDAATNNLDAATNNLDAATNNCGANQAAWTLRSPYELLFLGEINEVTASRDSLWSNTIVVPNEDFVVDTNSTLWTGPFRCVGATCEGRFSCAPTSARRTSRGRSSMRRT